MRHDNNTCLMADYTRTRLGTVTKTISSTQFLTNEATFFNSATIHSRHLTRLTVTAAFPAVTVFGRPLVFGLFLCTDGFLKADLYGHDLNLVLHSMFWRTAWQESWSSFDFYPYGWLSAWTWLYRRDCSATSPIRSAIVYSPSFEPSKHQ